MKILLLGKNGQVGWELQRALAPLGELVAYDRSHADLSAPASLFNVITNVAPDIIVNAAAYTAVDKAETEQELAYKVNAESLKYIAQAAKELGAWLINYSTDYVYDGEKNGCYNENDQTNPLSVYGETKLAGENFIRQSGCKYLNFRTSWVFASKGNNFAKSILKLGQERDALNIVADQEGAPTSAELIADTTAQIISKLNNSTDASLNNIIGTYHLVSSGKATWHSYAQYVIKKAIELGIELKISPENINPIKTSEYPLPAPRPKNSVLSTDKIEINFKIKLPHWSYYVDRMLEEQI